MLDRYGIADVQVQVPCGQSEHPVQLRLYPNAHVEVLYNPCDLLPDNLRRTSTCYEVLEAAEERLRLLFGYRMLNVPDLSLEEDLWRSERRRCSQSFYKRGWGTLNRVFWSYVQRVFAGREGYRRAVLEAGSTAPEVLQVWARSSVTADAACLTAVFRRIYGGSHPQWQGAHHFSAEARGLAWGSLKRLLEMLKGEASVQEAFGSLWSDSRPLVRRAAVAVLGQIGDPSAVPALIQRLEDKSLIVRQAAVAALGQIGDPSAVPALIQRLEDEDEDWEVREAAEWALDQIRQ